MPVPEDIQHQQDLLQDHRRTLGHLLRQRASLGAAHAPPGVLNGIDQARADIRQCKATLRAWNVAVEDLPDDEPQPDEYTSSSRRVPRCPPPNAGTLIGRDAVVDTLARQLTGGAQAVAVSAVRGLPGVGKSDLLRAVGSDARITAHFSGGVLYAELGPAPDLAQVLRGWLHELGVAPPQSDATGTLAAVLRRELADRRALLILDDVWDTRLAAAKTLRDCGSAALASSRSAAAASAVARDAAPLTLKELPDTDALALLARHAPEAVARELASAKDLAEALGGLPLASARPTRHRACCTASTRLTRTSRNARLRCVSGTWPWKTCPMTRRGRDYNREPRIRNREPGSVLSLSKGAGEKQHLPSTLIHRPSSIVHRQLPPTSYHSMRSLG